MPWKNAIRHNAIQYKLRLQPPAARPSAYVERRRDSLAKSPFASRQTLVSTAQCLNSGGLYIQQALRMALSSPRPTQSLHPPRKRLAHSTPTGGRTRSRLTTSKRMAQ